MNPLLLYFLKSGLAMALFYGIYILFMEKETNYSLNRFYLMGTLVLSLVLPVLPLERIFMPEQNVSFPVIFIGLDNQGIAASAVEVSNSSGRGFRLDGLTLAGIVYVCGVGLLLLSFLAQSLRLMLLRRVGKEWYGPMKVIFINRKIIPFSVLNRIFASEDLREDPKKNTILDHEYAHYRFFHFADLLFMELIVIFQWFNPFIWLYVRSLKEVHEYQADAAVLSSGEGTGTYQALLVNQLTGTEVFRLSNAFSKSLTKKRMIMMTRMKSKKSAWLKALFAVPVLAALTMVYAANASGPVAGDDTYLVKGKVVEAETGDALPGVSVVWKGTTTGTSTDKDGNFALKVKDKDAVVVYSFVGFETAFTKGAGDYTVKMGRKVFKITGESEAVTEKSTGKPRKEEKDIKPPATDAKDVFIMVEILPTFRGQNFNACKAYVQEHLEYPAKAKDAGIQGKVLVEFVVNAKGKVADARVVKGVDPMLDKAALAAVYSMPDWEPGKQHGKPVSVQFTIPVEFKLPNE